MAVHVITFYGRAGLCYMTAEAQPIKADPKWPSKINNGLVSPTMVWLNLRVKVKLRAN